MPNTFLFQCETCAHEFENWQTHSDPNPPCPDCAKPSRRLIAGGTDFILRGGGWTGKHYLGRVTSPKRKAPK